jgi:hypothetical protein
MAVTLFWCFWLVIFLLIELPNAADRKPGGTLSECMWSWFPGTWLRLLVLAFCVFLGLHLAFRWSVVPVAILGAWIVARIAWVEWRAWRRRRRAESFKHTMAKLSDVLGPSFMGVTSEDIKRIRNGQ